MRDESCKNPEMMKWQTDSLLWKGACNPGNLGQHVGDEDPEKEHFLGDRWREDERGTEKKEFERSWETLYIERERDRKRKKKKGREHLVEMKGKMKYRQEEKMEKKK